MSSLRIKQFLRYAFLKIKIALAIYIIKNTPPGQTAVEYATELQEAIFKLLRDNDDPLLARSTGTALRQQQRALTHQLSSIIRSTKAVSHCTASSLDSGFSSCELVDDGGDPQTSSLFSEYEVRLNFSEDVRRTLSANLDFIRGIVRLQHFVRTEGDDEPVANGFDSTVPNEISGIPWSEKDLHRTEVVNITSSPNYRVASGVLQYALQSSGAEEVVKKSVREIQQHMCGIALKGLELPYIILNWEGSLFQHSIMLIRKLSDEKPYQKAIVESTGGLATIVITDMLKNYGLEKNTKHENQVTLLLQLCGNTATCLHVLKILIDKINMISSKSVAMHQSRSTLTPIARTINFENCFYIFYLTEKLLTRYCALQEINNSSYENPNKDRKENKLTELWRGAWDRNNTAKTSPNTSNQQLSDSAKLLQSWCASLENAFKVFSVNYPLITLYAGSCLEIITAYQIKDWSHHAKG